MNNQLFYEPEFEFYDTYQLPEIGPTNFNNMYLPISQPFLNFKKIGRKYLGYLLNFSSET